MFRARLSLERLENREAPSGIEPVNPVDVPAGTPPGGPPAQTPPPSDPGPPVNGPVG